MGMKRILLRTLSALTGAVLGLLAVPILGHGEGTYALSEILPATFIGVLAGILLPAPTQFLLKKKQSFVRVFLLLLTASAITWAFYFPLPNVAGLSYKEARTEILRNGWKPLELKRDGWWGTEYPEVISCMADANSCGLAFRRYGFQCLTVGTDHGFSKVYGANRECYE